MKGHELDRNGAGMLRETDGRRIDSMMAVGKAPWHYALNANMVRLLDQQTNVTSKQVNWAAGLTWNVYQTPAYIFVGEDNPKRRSGRHVVLNPSGEFKLVGTRREAGKPPMPDYFLNVRDEINRVIGVVKKRYRVFQNAEAPLFLDNLVDSGDASYETAGSLHGGSQVWWLMKLPEGVNIAGDPREKIETYILLTNSHDGSTSIVVAVVPIRVVCQNTLAWALKGAQRTMKVKHTESAKDQFIEARRTLEIGFTYQQALREIGDQLANTTISDQEFQTFLDSLLPTPAPITKDGRATNQRGITMAENTKNLITGIYHHNDTQTHLEGTLWGAVQAVQYYSDHLSINRNTDDASADENRFKRLTSGANLGSRGLAQETTLIGRPATQRR